MGFYITTQVKSIVLWLPRKGRDIAKQGSINITDHCQIGFVSVGIDIYAQLITPKNPFAVLIEIIREDQGFQILYGYVIHRYRSVEKQRSDENMNHGIGKTSRRQFNRRRIV